ncbi:MAG: DUF4347 domain-containing protein [Rivularia sp. (in: Bacteria)]|nr:DUF4347 domain-containing protein [Rivularia sp. MS3]
MTNNRVNALVVIDPAIKDFHILEKSIKEGIIPQAEALILQPNKKEVQQISSTVQKFSELSELHIISQGSPGCLYLGNSSLSVNNFNFHASQLRKWSVNNLYLYGCNIGAEEMGKKLLVRLYRTTGAVISTLTSDWGMHTKIGVGIWNTTQYTLIKQDFTALTA